MTVTIHNLIQVAPFPEETRKKLLDKVDKMSDDQRFRLIDLCWFGIAGQFQSRLNYEIDKAIMETARGEKHYSQNDFEEIKAKLTHEFAQKLKAAESQESIEEVKQQLEKYKTQPMPQDQTVGTPPSQKP